MGVMSIARNQLLLLSLLHHQLGKALLFARGHAPLSLIVVPGVMTLPHSLPLLHCLQDQVENCKHRVNQCVYYSNNGSVPLSAKKLFYNEITVFDKPACDASSTNTCSRRAKIKLVLIMLSPYHYYHDQ